MIQSATFPNPEFRVDRNGGGIAGASVGIPGTSGTLAGETIADLNAGDVITVARGGVGDVTLGTAGTSISLTIQRIA